MVYYSSKGAHIQLGNYNIYTAEQIEDNLRKERLLRASRMRENFKEKIALELSLEEK